MKTNLFQLGLLFLLCTSVLCGCTNDDEQILSTDGSTLTIHVTADGFASTDGAVTRASEDGYTTKFINGDKIGVFAVKDNSVIEGCNNVPLTYNGTSWIGSVYPYKDAQYFAYYPYNESMNGKTSVEKIVEAFTPLQPDQSTYANYTKSDLMTTDVVSPSNKVLNFKFEHKMSLIEISLPVQDKYTTSDGYEYTSPVIGATFNITSNGHQQQSITPYNMGGGVYRYIVPADGSHTVSGEFQTSDGKTIRYSEEKISLSAGLYMRLNVSYEGAPPSGEPQTRELKVGDYFYSDGGIVPENVENPPSEGCIGIVYWLGDIKEDNYGLLDSRFPNGTHGLVISLWDMPDPDDKSNDKMAWTYGKSEYVGHWLGSATWSDGNPRPGNFTSIAGDNMQGYANTIALEEYNKYIEGSSKKNQNFRVKPVKGLAAFQEAHPVPSNSSGWYWPSKAELINSILPVEGRLEMLNQQIQKIDGGTVLFKGGEGNGHWPSSESNEYNAHYMNISNGYPSTNDNASKTSSLYRVRPVLAF